MKVNYKLIKKKPGIYYIKNIITKRVYIGQSVNCYKRLICHLHLLNNNKHNNVHLQRSFNKRPINHFKCGVIEYTNVDLNNKEKFYIINQPNGVYNIDFTCNVNHGFKRKPISEETRYKLINSRKGKKPKNLKWLQESNKRLINYYVNNILIKQFNSCKEAAEYFKLTPNAFHCYIGKTIGVKKSSKYFKRNTRIEYAETREGRYNNE